MNLTLLQRWPGWPWNWGGLWNPERGEQRAGPMIGSTSTGRPVTDERAMSIGAVFRCIRLLSETCSSLPLCAYKRINEYDREPLPYDHWLPRLLREPNETMTGDELVESWVAQMAGWGNAFSQIVPSDDGRPIELWPYKVDSMRVERRENRTLQYQYPDMKGRPTILPDGRVLHMRAFSVDGIMGLSPLGMARNTMALSIAAEDYAGSFFSSGGRPSGVMTSDKLLSDKQREQIRREFGGIADGADGKRFWLMEASLKYEPITVSPEDMQMLQTRSFEIKEIARFFGVPLFLLMETEGQTSWGTGLEQNNSAFLLYALRPYLSRIQSTLNRFIIPEKERKNIFVEFDESALLWADTTAMTEFLSGSVNNAIMTRNEARRRIKLARSPQKNADTLTAQTAMAPIDTLGQQPRPTGDPGMQKDLADILGAIRQLEQLQNNAAKTAGDLRTATSSSVKIKQFIHQRDANGRIIGSTACYEDSQ